MILSGHPGLYGISGKTVGLGSQAIIPIIISGPFIGSGLGWLIKRQHYSQLGRRGRGPRWKGEKFPFGFSIIFGLGPWFGGKFLTGEFGPPVGTGARVGAPGN